MRASGRGSGVYAVAGAAACITALLVLYRILQEPGFDEVTTVQIGAPLALGVLGLYAFACAMALREPEAEPTSHVVDLTNVLREDVPRDGLDRETALEQAPDAASSGFRVPSPGAS